MGIPIRAWNYSENLFNVVVEVKPVHQVIDDDVDKILSYDKVTEAISDEVFAERVNLLETLAERIADRVLMSPKLIEFLLELKSLIEVRVL